jgi:hypothetical protein
MLSLKLQHPATERHSIRPDPSWRILASYVPKEGRYEYFCTLHPNKKGTLTVRYSGRTRDLSAEGRSPETLAVYPLPSWQPELALAPPEQRAQAFRPSPGYPSLPHAPDSPSPPKTEARR